MKRWILSPIVALTLLMVSPFPGKAQGIEFTHGTWQETLDLAKKSNKLVFVDAFAVWCGPCKWMAANAFTNAEVGNFFNEHFVNYKFDMEKGEGPAFAQKYGVTAYPTLYFLNGDGGLVHRSVGALSGEALLEVGKRVANGGESLEDMETRFMTGKYDRAWLTKYLVALGEAEMDASEPYFEWSDGMNMEELFQEQNFRIFLTFNPRLDSKHFKYFAENQKKFEEALGPETVEEALIVLYEREVRRQIDESNMAEAERVIQRFEGTSVEDRKSLAFDMRLAVAQAFEDWDRYFEVAMGNEKSEMMADAYTLNSIAWTLYEKVTDKKMLKKALEWAKIAVNAEPVYAIMDTYAMLLYANGKTKEAMDWAEKAIQIAHENGEDCSATEEAVKKWKEN